jgi:hypothetical protein
MDHGPVDLLVLTFSEPKFNGLIVDKLEELAKTGTIRVLDAALVSIDEAGTRRTLDIEDVPAELSAVLGYVDDGTRGLFDADDLEALFEGLVPGSAAAAIAIEHLWVGDLAAAVEGAGGELALEVRVPSVFADEAFAGLAGA